MKVLHLGARDVSGGAAKAANSLSKALRDLEIDSYLLVQKKQSDDINVLSLGENILYRLNNFLREKLDPIELYLYKNRKRGYWSVNWLYNNVLIRRIKKLNPDIINLHWIHNGFMSLSQLKEIEKLNIPIVWTLHDSWAFTGGCHIPYSCKRYMQKCGNCPILNSKKQRDLSYKIWGRKSKIFETLDITIVTPSNWLKKCAYKSSLFRKKKIIRIANAVDMNKFKLINKIDARKKLNLSFKKKYILFGAMSATTDKNKGFDLLVRSLKNLKELENSELIVFGNKGDLDVKIEIPIIYLGIIRNPVDLNLLYSAVDVTVIPSRSENFSLISLESLACNTPVVSFNLGGFVDLIKHKKNGFLAKPFDTKNFSEGITWVLKNREQLYNTREAILNNYTLEIQARKYKALYEKLISDKNRKNIS